MWQLLWRAVGPRAVVLVLGLGAVAALAAASLGRPGQLLAGLLAVAAVAGAVGLLFAYWIKRSNADIDGDRDDLRRELDRLVDDEQ